VNSYQVHCTSMRSANESAASRFGLRSKKRWETQSANHTNNLAADRQVSKLCEPPERNDRRVRLPRWNLERPIATCLLGISAKPSPLAIDGAPFGANRNERFFVWRVEALRGTPVVGEHII